MASETRKPLPGLVHHSDRGIQYASGEYVAILETARHGTEHEPASQPVRQCQLRELHQNAEARRDLRERVREHGSFAEQHRRVHWAVLQPEAATLRFRLSLAGRIRSASQARK